MSENKTEYGFWVRQTEDSDREWVSEIVTRRWGSPVVVTRGVPHSVIESPGLLAMRREWPLGLLTYRIDARECEVLTLDSMIGGLGIGTLLVSAIQETARSAGCKRLWLMTTNDNTLALRYYQKRGFTLAAVYPNALAKSRELKPEIPEIGQDGIPLRDEIELEMML